MKKVLKGFGRLLAILLLTVLFVLINAAAACAAMAYGPSPAWQSRFAAAFDESSALNFLPRLFLSDETVEELLHPTPTPEVPDAFRELALDTGDWENSESEQPQPTEPPEEQHDVIELIDIKQPAFQGKLLAVHDPSLVVIASLDRFGGAGMLLTDFISQYGAIGGANGAGFINGGSPDGMVIRDGTIVRGSAGGWYRDVVGFDADHVLHVGDMTGREALDLGLVSAVSFSKGPVLIKDGEIQSNLAGGGINPRTCIGQTADGTVLLLVVDGRRPDSPGATNWDTAQVLYDHGAINAGNLDGGGSSDMYYQGEHIIWNDYGLRIPTAILVMDPDTGDGGEQ